MYEIKRANRLSHTSVHFVTARASLFTDHKISGQPMDMSEQSVSKQ